MHVQACLVGGAVQLSEAEEEEVRGKVAELEASLAAALPGQGSDIELVARSAFKLVPRRSSRPHAAPIACVPYRCAAWNVVTGSCRMPLGAAPRMSDGSRRRDHSFTG